MLSGICRRVQCKSGFERCSSENADINWQVMLTLVAIYSIKTPEKWKENVQKRKRVRGEEYVSRFTGKNFAQAKQKANHSCRMQCYDVLSKTGVSKAQRLAHFTEFRKVNKQSQYSYLWACRTETPPQRSKKSTKAILRRFNWIEIACRSICGNQNLSPSHAWYFWF